MPLSIKHPEADRLARIVAERTGESITEAVLTALRERLSHVSNRATASTLREELRAIRERCARLPVLDPRTPDEIIGYDDYGVPR
jgi:antitoxin VapB